MSKAGGVIVQGVPLDVNSEELKKTFSQIGPIVSVAPIFNGAYEVSEYFFLFRFHSRRLNDDDYKQQHYFVTYRDYATAMSAVRNLNGIQISGQSIKVMLQKDAETSRGSFPDSRARASQYKETIDLIDRAPLHELWDLMADFNMIPEKEATLLLQRDPKLAHAVLQAQIRLGVVPVPETPRDPRMRRSRR